MSENYFEMPTSSIYHVHDKNQTRRRKVLKIAETIF